MTKKKDDEVYTSVKIPTNVSGIGYTLKHRNCVEQLIKYYCTQARNRGQLNQMDCQVMAHRGICHDMNKLLTSLSYPQLTADYIHCMMQGYYTANGQLVPFRRQLPFQTTRPSEVCSQSNSINRRELIRGTAEVNVFDMDAICNIRAEDISTINKSFYARIKESGYQYQR